MWDSHQAVECEVDELNTLRIEECEAAQEANDPCTLTRKTLIDVKEAELENHSNQAQLSVKECEATQEENEPCYMTNKAMFSGKDAEKIETLTEEVEKLKVLLIYSVSLESFHYSFPTDFQFCQTKF